MNPYEILGVPPTASDAQIKSAYRQRAKATHPDVCKDDGSAFAEASRAYGILMDPEMRKRFDEIGSVEDVAPMTVRQRMIQIIALLFNAALEAEAQRGTPLKHFDMMEAMRQNMRVNLDQVRIARDKHAKSVLDRQFLLKKITRKGDGENLFAEIIKQQLPELEKLRNMADIEVRAMEMATEELAAYKSEVELVQAMQMMQFGGMFGTASTSTTSVFTFR